MARALTLSGPPTKARPSQKRRETRKASSSCCSLGSALESLKFLYFALGRPANQRATSALAVANESPLHCCYSTFFLFPSAAEVHLRMSARCLVLPEAAVFVYPLMPILFYFWIKIKKKIWINTRVQGELRLSIQETLCFACFLFFRERVTGL